VMGMGTGQGRHQDRGVEKDLHRPPSRWMRSARTSRWSGGWPSSGCSRMSRPPVSRTAGSERSGSSTRRPSSRSCRRVPGARPRHLLRNDEPPYGIDGNSYCHNGKG
jgi:hypothetical protein